MLVQVQADDTFLVYSYIVPVGYVSLIWPNRI